jgi:hypothetical protein
LNNKVRVRLAYTRRKNCTMKRLCQNIAGFVFALSLLAACGGGGNSSTTTVCPTGQTGTYPNCTAIACPTGQTGTYPSCTAIVCPTGQFGTYPNCTAIACPAGQTGTFPDCITTVVAPYTDNNNGTITQTANGLVWQRQDDGLWRDWVHAGAYCTGLVLADYRGWRLPTIEELKGIVDTSYTPKINPMFRNTQPSLYWSSTPLVSVTTYAWSVNFNDGLVYDYNKSLTHYVRCVRLGQ